jgi:hypothetical protein
VATGTLKCRVFRARKQLHAWMLGEDEAQAAVAEKSPVKRAPRAASRFPRIAPEDDLRLS